MGAENLWVGRGQCTEHLGAGEAYLPLHEALGQLARRTEGQSLIPLLRRHAPTWFVRMPAFIEEAELDLLSRRGHGATSEQMGRQLSEALEALTAESPLILWLEDLHWGDPSTVDLLAMLARRRAPARLLAPRAVHYLRQAAPNALRRSAGQEAADLLTRALEQLQAYPRRPSAPSKSCRFRRAWGRRS